MFVLKLVSLEETCFACVFCCCCICAMANCCQHTALMLPMKVVSSAAAIMGICAGLAFNALRCLTKKLYVSMIPMKNPAHAKQSRGLMYDAGGVRRRGGSKHKRNLA